MNVILFIVMPLAIAAVAIVLFMGLANMARGGDPARSQTLMRWRVVLQALAVVLAMLTIYLIGR
ncbi:MAG TPA: twin transmembrane helix small protein [Hyphomicrobiales bacterium]|nr:twin transmembrane helix small protein [Kaistiaceae bacterium]HQF31302.1 twin transmembrane helix small protein [Hyphomicrobiales bacterium]